MIGSPTMPTRRGSRLRVAAAVGVAPQRLAAAAAGQPFVATSEKTKPRKERESRMCVPAVRVEAPVGVLSVNTYLKATENDRKEGAGRPDVSELLGRCRWPPDVARDIALKRSGVRLPSAPLRFPWVTTGST